MNPTLLYPQKYAPETVNEPPSCCQKKTLSCCEPSAPSPWLKKIDAICRIALGAFAAYIAPFFFTVSFMIGAAVGLGYSLHHYFQHRNPLPDGENKPICAQGYMDFLSGMRFSPMVGTPATAAFIAAHMRHDPQFFVPFGGFFIGFWVGKESASHAYYLSGRILSV
jgi:hypothetical protein